MLSLIFFITCFPTIFGGPIGNLTTNSRNLNPSKYNFVFQPVIQVNHNTANGVSYGPGSSSAGTDNNGNTFASAASTYGGSASANAGSSSQTGVSGPYSNRPPYQQSSSQQSANSMAQGNANGSAGMQNGMTFASANSGHGGLASSSAGSSNHHQISSPVSQPYSKPSSQNLPYGKSYGDRCFPNQCGHVKHRNYAQPLICHKSSHTCLTRRCNNQRGCKQINSNSHCGPLTKECEFCPSSCLQRYTIKWQINVCCTECPRSC